MSRSHPHKLQRWIDLVAALLSRRFSSSNVTLTSRPSREAANRLYVRLGFQRIETNVYRYVL